LAAVTDNLASADPAGSGVVAAGELHFGLDHRLPEALAVGAGSAVFVCGWCFSPQARIRSLELSVDGAPQPLMDHGMPRRDVFEAMHPALDPFGSSGLVSDPQSLEDPQLHAFRSGFWGLARVPPTRGPGDCVVGLRAALEDGSRSEAELARIAIAPLTAEPLRLEPEAVAGPLVAICMATHEPPLELLERQLESIRGQTHRNWVCVISDDCSQPELFAAMSKLVDGDPRFAVSRAPRRLGFYRNFERALSLAPAHARYVAMADQDDFWHASKLATLLEAIGESQLVYSDARVVSRDGELISNTYWAERRNEHSDISSLLVANAVTGGASLLRREVLDYALPFPPAQFGHFHDHWVALTALALGDVDFVERPLYDYVQHGGAVLGHAAANRMPALGDRVRRLRDPLRRRIRRWRLTFFVDACRLIQFASILLMRCGERMPARKRRALQRFMRADRSIAALAWLALRGARDLAARRSQTLGAELGLFFGFAWRRLALATTRGAERPRRRLRIDALPPTTLVQTPGRRPPDSPTVQVVADKVAPLRLAPGDDVPERVNLLIPTIDLDHLFGGYIAKLNLARRLAERGLRTRIVTVDPVGALPPTWARRLESYSGLAGLFERVEVVFGRESSGLEVSRSDRFIATTWWTAHVARAALEALGGGRFLYLIQEYEPFTFPMGSFAALATESYRFPHAALFSSELLRDWFRRRGIGVYAEGREGGDARSASFQNAITPVASPAVDELAARESRRLLFYARPEEHAARNMFELGVLALARAAEQGAFQRGYELHGIGTVESRRRVGLGGGLNLELLPRAGQDDYAALLREHDVGLALMYTPHPSLVPIEMAAAGMLTVTNSFENKTPEAMTAISPNIVAAEPTVEGVAGALVEAVAGVDDFQRRVDGSRVGWSDDWDRSFDDGLMERVEKLLG
jgi:glycosyltransferase involved in cell wall biosynthesis